MQFPTEQKLGVLLRLLEASRTPHFEYPTWALLFVGHDSSSGVDRLVRSWWLELSARKRKAPVTVSNASSGIRIRKLERDSV